MAMTRFIYPNVDVESMDDMEEFGRLAMEADWVGRMVYGDGESGEGNETPPPKGGRQTVKRTM